jgi:hypothetical protein
MKTVFSLAAAAVFALALTACKSSSECKTCDKPTAKASCPAGCTCGMCGTDDCKCHAK